MSRSILEKNNLGGSSQPNCFSCLNIDVVSVLDLWICQSVCLQGSGCSIVKAMCLTFHTGIVQLFGVLKKKIVYTRYLSLLSQKILPRLT